MRKYLLLGVVLTATAGALAVTPRTYRESYILAVSPDGRTLAAELNGTVKIIDVESGKTDVFAGDGVMGYSLGMGRPVSQDNTIVGSVSNMAAYYSGGMWHELPTPYPANINLANSITPDGRRICGAVGAQAFGLEDVLSPMEVPAVWTRLDDGTYGDPEILPYPTADYTGAMPQYVMAVAISDDGNTVVGQVRDNSGFMTTLIFYTYADGQWTMHNEFMSLANPKGIEIPPAPGEEPEIPSVYSFMTEQELEDYQAAVAAWEAAGTWDYSTYPLEEDYMTPEEYAAYVEAWTAYVAEYEEWEKEYVAYHDALQACDSQTLVFNNVLVSGDGRKAVSTGILSYPPPAGSMMERLSYTPIVFDLQNGTHTIYPDKGMNASYLAADGTLLAFDGGVYKPRQAWVYLPGEEETPLSMLEYFATRDEATANWMQKHMLHDVDVFSPDGGPATTSHDFLCSGTPCASPDLSIIVCAIENVWDYSTEVESYLLPDSSRGAGITPTTLKTDGLVHVFGLDGTLVHSGCSVPADLQRGVYIIRQGGKTSKVIR